MSKKGTLFTLDAEFNELHEKLADFDGDISDEAKEKEIDALFEQIAENEELLEQKVDGYIYVIAEFEEGAEACDAEIARLTDLRDRRTAEATKLRERLKLFMVTSKREKLTTPMHSLKLKGVGGKRALVVDDGVDIATIDANFTKVIPEQIIPEKIVLDNDVIRGYCEKAETDEELPALPWARLADKKIKLEIK